MDPVILLDGGMGQELLRHSSRRPSPLWSAQVMLEEPELVERAHAAFIGAGADVITLNAYSATRCRLRPFGLEDRYEDLQRAAGESAVAARDAFGPDRPVRIAGCLSPYRWSYRPELAPPFDELWPQYAETARLQARYADLILCETMGSIEEAQAARRGALETGLPIWVSWSLRDDRTERLRSGESLADAVRELGPVDAMLVNCSVPEALTAAMPTLAGGGRPFGAYANGFTQIAAHYAPGSVTTELDGRTDLGPETYADVVDEWLSAGATIVGGCCEIGPDHIAELRRRIDRVAASA